MKLNAIGVFSSNIQKTVRFYQTLGFQFPEIKDEIQHIETINLHMPVKLMIDTKQLVKDLIGEEPITGNTSTFAIEFDKSRDIDETVNKIRKAGFKIHKEPWNAFWGQRYAVIEDPDGFRVDLYARL